jgi:hypothetical protein
MFSLTISLQNDAETILAQECLVRFFAKGLNTANLNNPADCAQKRPSACVRGTHQVLPTSESGGSYQDIGHTQVIRDWEDVSQHGEHLSVHLESAINQ